jgi:hypothetical protein
MLWGALGERKIFKQTTDMTETVDSTHAEIEKIP